MISAMRLFSRFASLALLMAMVGGLTWAGDWNQFRGPTADGQSTSGPIPLKWGPQENITWKVSLPGVGHSSPVVARDRIFLTSCIEETQERLVLCHDFVSGKELWRKTVATSPLEIRHKNSSCANSTPATDGERVYSSFLDRDRYLLFCHDFHGKLVWKRDLGKYVNKHGFCSSPILTSEMVVIVGDNDEAGFIAAVDPKSGNDVWRHTRSDSVRSFSVTVPIQAGGKDQLLVAGCRSLTSLEPKTGKEFWKVTTPTEKYVAAAVLAEGVAVVTGTSPANTLWGIDPTGSGEVTENKVLWKESQHALYTCSPVAVGPYVFGVTDNGIAWCLEAKTGKKMWVERLGKAHHASLLHADGHILALDEEGVCHVFLAGPKFQLVRRNKIGEPCHATPALANGSIVLRTEKSLFRIK